MSTSMNVYEELKELFVRLQVTNLFAITGNIRDILLVQEENQPSRYLNIRELLLEKFSQKNHVLLYNPSEGVHYYQPQHKEEFFKYEDYLETKYASQFNKTFYNMISGIHLIKELLQDYRQLGKTKGQSVKCLIVIMEDVDLIFSAKPSEQMAVDEKLLMSQARSMLDDYEVRDSNNMVVLLTTSFFSLNSDIRDIPHLREIHVDLPNFEQRKQLIAHVNQQEAKGFSEVFINEIAASTAGISLVNLLGILREDPQDIKKNIHRSVARLIEKSIGGHVKMFYPEYGFEKIIGYEELKAVYAKLILRMEFTPWKGIILTGPTGTGKSFQLKAFVKEANVPAMQLGNIKSKWYGETLIIVEKIKNVAKTFDKLIITKPEADTMFTDPQTGEGHQTDLELMGAFLDWIGDEKDRGKIFWIFDTSRPQRIPLDFQRRLEIKIGIFDLEGDFKWEFLLKMFDLAFKDETQNLTRYLIDHLKQKSAVIADFSDEQIFGSPEYAQIKEEILKLVEGYSNDNMRGLATEVVSEIMVETEFDILELIRNINLGVVIKEREAQAWEAARYCTYRNIVPAKYRDRVE